VGSLIKFVHQCREFCLKEQYYRHYTGKNNKRRLQLQQDFYEIEFYEIISQKFSVLDARIW